MIALFGVLIICSIFTAGILIDSSIHKLISKMDEVLRAIKCLDGYG